MATVNLTADTFRETVEGNDTVFIDFWAEWCGPCRMFGPIYEEASENNPDIVFAKVDTDVERALAQDFQISSIPTLMAIRDGVVLYSQPGALPKANFEELITAVRNVDMEQVRADIAAQEQGDVADQEKGE
jgi:thioredoxin 1